jgi:hypothetical protein
MRPTQPAGQPVRRLTREASGNASVFERLKRCARRCAREIPAGAAPAGAAPRAADFAHAAPRLRGGRACAILAILPARARLAASHRAGGATAERTVVASVGMKLHVSASPGGWIGKALGLKMDFKEPTWTDYIFHEPHGHRDLGRLEYDLQLRHQATRCQSSGCWCAADALLRHVAAKRASTKTT